MRAKKPYLALYQYLQEQISIHEIPNLLYRENDKVHATLIRQGVPPEPLSASLFSKNDVEKIR